MRVGVDLDGVCYDFAHSFRRALFELGVYNDYKVVEGEPDNWHFYLDWGLTQDEFVQFCHQGVDRGTVFGYGGPRDDAPAALSFLRAMGHSIHIVTDRSFGTVPENSHDVTRKWLSHFGFEYDTLTFSADKTCVPTDVFIEDKLENYDALVAAGVDCYLVDRPWNQDGDDGRKRIKSIQQFATIVGNMTV
ncbi:phosphatase [Streptomyces phage Comrade]|uniref:Phosphatase n=3 Tax=Gilsonvirus comrade TaxID=2846395 RepID=A0A345ME14_9CAUD|nr:phosphatase [Streptomyces phage Comrade]AXH68795.1 phosphatase [Streptomyces phage SparkleGoddess]AXQ63353.1 phosphatase [Streptomyces phage Comrade]QQO39770.1 5' nucleotidase [Streptomyces phage Belfort]